MKIKIKKYFSLDPYSVETYFWAVENNHVEILKLLMAGYVPEYEKILWSVRSQEVVHFFYFCLFVFFSFFFSEKNCGQ